LLSREFAFLILSAIVVAWPISYFTIKLWLGSFAYRTDIGLGTFILSGLAVLLVAWPTVSYQTLRAALANPVDALRYE